MRKKGEFRHPLIIVFIVMITFASILIVFRSYLFDTYSIFDDQRNVLKTVKVYDQAPLDHMFFSAPLYFGIFIGLNNMASNLIIIKWLFLVTVPLFIIFVYNIGRFIFQRNDYRAPYLVVAITMICSLWYLKMLIDGYPKSLALPLLLGVVYFVLRNKKIWAFLFLALIAFIYPPQFLIGISFFALCSLYEIYSHFKKTRERPAALLKLSSTRFLLFLSIFLIAYAAYFVLFMQPADIEDSSAGESATQSMIDIRIEKEIYDTRTDVLLSSGKLLGVIPRQYLDNRRMGLFGLTSGTKRTLIIMFPLFCMLAIRRKKFVFPHFLFVFFISGISLFILAHVFYKNLYFPSRYPAYTFPFVFFFLFGLNLIPSIEKAMGKVLLMRKKYKWIMSLLIVFSVIIVVYAALYRKIIYFGERYHRSDSAIFTVIIICLLVLAALLVKNSSSQILRRSRNFFVTGSLVVFIGVLLTYYKETATPPVNVYDKNLFPFIESLGDNVSFAGYPEMMNNIQALTSHQIKVSLGQERRHENALEFYRFLDAYYAADLNKVYRYMSTKQYDYLIVQKDYYDDRLTEYNNLFSFYPLLRRHEEKLKKENENQFVLLNPAKDIIEFETPKSYVISYRKLKEIS